MTKTKFIIGYLTVIGLIVGCTVTMIKIKDSNEVDVKNDSSRDSLDLGDWNWSDDDQLDLNRKDSIRKKDLDSLGK